MTDISTLGETIGKGSYGKVYYTQRNGRECAVKRMSLHKTRGLRYDSVREIIFLKELASSNIVPRIHEFEVADGYVYVFMDAYETSLSKFLKSASSSEKRACLSKVHRFLMKVLRVLHKYNIQHLDIKPGNIVINPHNLKMRLVDFGFASYVRSWHEHEVRRVATRWYRPPEYLFPKGARVAFMCDAWCCGMTLLQAILGKSLWKPIDDYELKECLCKVEKTHSIPSDEFLYNLGNGKEFSGSIDVRYILKKHGKEADEDIVKDIEAMLSFDPRVRAKKLGISSHDLDKYTPFLHADDPVECMIGKKLYFCEDDSFRDTCRKLKVSSKELAGQEIRCLHKYLAA